MHKILLGLALTFVYPALVAAQSCNPGPTCVAKGQSMAPLVRRQYAKADSADGVEAALARYCISMATSLVAKDCADEFAKKGDKQCSAKALKESDTKLSSAKSYLADASDNSKNPTVDDFTINCQ